MKELSRGETTRTSWFRMNVTLGNIITLVVVLVSIATGFSKLESSTVQAVREAAQAKRDVDTHTMDLNRHVDIRMEENRWRYLEARLDRIEKKLDALK